MKNYGKEVTKEMVYERTCILISSLKADFNLSVMQEELYKKRIEIAYVLLKRLMSNKVPPALIFALLNKHFGTTIGKRAVDIKVIKEAKSRITNPINLN
jgi:hypothetical protein